MKVVGSVGGGKAVCWWQVEVLVEVFVEVLLQVREAVLVDGGIV